MNVKACIFSVVHKGSINYFSSFLRSLDTQTNQNFDLFLVVDKVPRNSLLKIVNSDSHNFKVSYFEYSGGILENRVKGLQNLASKRDKYEVIIFADSDDILSDNYVGEVLEDIQHYDFVFSDLVPFFDDAIPEKKVGVWHERFKNCHILQVDFLKDKNVLGFGNTSVSFKVIERINQNYPEPLAPDWYFFKQILTKDDRLKFNKNTSVLYRQYPTNFIGYKLISPQRLRHILNVKEDHYNLMFYNDKILTEEIKTVKALIKANEELVHVIEMINRKEINYFWWEETNYLKKMKNE
jgi:hypothetical protein